MFYPVTLEADDNGTFLVTCKAFPELTTYGKDEAEARVHAVGALEEAIAARIAAGEAVPPPATERRGGKALPVMLPLLTMLKVNLYNTLQRQGVSRAELARRLGWHREQVDRLFRLDHASRLDQIEEAFKALDRNITVRVLHGAA